MKDYIKSDVIKVSDTNGDLKLGVNILKQLVEEERPSVFKERKNDIFNISLKSYIWLLDYKI